MSATIVPGFAARVDHEVSPSRKDLAPALAVVKRENIPGMDEPKGIALADIAENFTRAQGIQ